MITAQVERIADTLPELQRLLPEHYDELSVHKGHFPLSPRYEVYLERERKGEVLLVTVRRDGVLVGYWITFLGMGLHYSTCLTGTFDIFYIEPAHRRSVAPLLLGRKVKAELQKRGVKLWYAGEKHCRPEAGRLYEKLGMKPVETFYCMWLGE